MIDVELDRVQRSHEQWFHFVKSPRYFAAVDEVREAHAPWTIKAYEYEQKNHYNRKRNGDRVDKGDARDYAVANPLGKLPGSVWTLPADDVVQRIIRGWSPSGICTACGEGRRPVVEKRLEEIGHKKPHRFKYDAVETGEPGGRTRAVFNSYNDPENQLVARTEATITGYACACPDATAPTRPAVILDPFDPTGIAILGSDVDEQQTRVINASALDLPLPDASVDLIITSPPYFALRSYRDGDEHYDGQIGSEATPQDFLEALWAATREMVRVLKPTGSIFVNLGDSYAGSGGHNNSNIGANPERGPKSYRRPVGPTSWTKANAAWLAGVIDCDGSVSIRSNGTPSGNAAPSFVAWTRVGQMVPEVVERIVAVTGVGKAWQDGRGVWNWCAAAQQARYVLERIWPWLRIKQRQAWAAIHLQSIIEQRGAKGTWSPLLEEEIAYRRHLKDAVVAWNRGRAFDCDVPVPVPIPLPEDEIRPRPKSLHMLPARYAIGCIDQLGLILRAEVIWSKPNGLPESVTDRVRRSHEQWFHFTKQGRYFAAVDEVREAHAPASLERYKAPFSPDSTNGGKGALNSRPDYSGVLSANPLGKLPGSVWTIPSEPLLIPEAVQRHYNLPDHFAAFPTEWPRRIILGWSPAGICTACGEPRRPVVEKEQEVLGVKETYTRSEARKLMAHPGGGLTKPGYPITRTEATITGYACACPDTTAPTRPAVVLDPFGGTGTVAMVARTLGRVGISVDLSADYCRLAEWRIFQSGHAAKAEARTWDERQTTIFGGTA